MQSRLNLSERERYKEGRALIFDRFEPDASTMTHDEFMTEVESKTGATDFTDARIVRPHKATENIPLLMGRNADAMVAHRQYCRIVLKVFAHRNLNIAPL